MQKSFQQPRILRQPCSTSKIVTMKRIFLCFIIVASCAVVSLAEDKGNCPLAPPVERRRTNSSGQSGNITIQAVVSDTGTCAAPRSSMASTKNPHADAKNAMRQWHFAPAKRNGRPVPVVVNVEVHYERDKDGHVILSSHQSTPTEEAPKQ